MTVAIAVPIRADGGRRDDLWRFCRRWWEAEFPAWPIIEGTDDLDGPFNISQARNRAALETGADVTVHIDADVLPRRARQVREAVDLAERTGRLTIGHDRWCSLDRRGSRRVLGGYVGSWSPYVVTEKPLTVSNIVVVPSSLDVRFDEQFQGWGCEDTAFAMAATTIGGGSERVHGDVFHLWHPKQRGAEDDPHRIANKARRDRYRDAFGDVDATRALLDEALIHA